MTTTITVTSPVSVAPTALIAIRCRQRPSRWRSQWRIIPIWARVNATKTPSTYRWTSSFVFALKPISSAIASTASTRIPFE